MGRVVGESSRERVVDIVGERVVGRVVGRE